MEALICRQAECALIDEEHLAEALEDAWERLHTADGDAALDLSAVRRIGLDGITALQRLAARADEEGVKVVLLGVNVEVYKVLKLVSLAQRFSFTT